MNGRILLFEPYNSWQEALNYIGERYRRFRSDKKAEIFKTPAFGMPVMHNSFRTRLVPYENTENRLSERWASPVIFKVIKGKEESYFPVVIFLNPGGVNFIGKEEKVDKWKKREVEQVNNFEIFSSFIKDYLKPIKELAL